MDKNESKLVRERPRPKQSSLFWVQGKDPISPIDPETQLGRNGPSNVVLGSLCAAVLIDNCAANLYAALYGRGLYGDGAHYLLWIADHNRLYLFAHARRTVDVLRQAFRSR